MDPDISTAEDAFGVLASRPRLQLLQALADNSDGSPCSFTELYDKVEITNTSQFSYHLNALTDRYVRQSTDGYTISDAGRRVIQLVRAGEYTVQPEFEPVTVSTSCPYCDGKSAEATYDGQLATVDCLSCENTLLRYDLRPAHTEDRRSLGALKAADRQMRSEFGSAIDGVCQRCGGSIHSKLRTGAETGPAAALLICDCQHCGTTLSTPVKIALLHHPAVISRYWEETLDTLSAPTWELFSLISDWEVEICDSGTTAELIFETRKIVIGVHQQGIQFHSSDGRSDSLV